MSLATNPALTYITQTIAWYDQAAMRNRLWFLFLKLVQISLLALIPLVGLVPAWKPWQSLITGSIAAVLLIIEGLQQTCQFQQQWIKFRSSHSALCREQSLFEAKGGSYRGVDDPLALFAERANAIISAENTAWESIHTPNEGTKK